MFCIILFVHVQILNNVYHFIYKYYNEIIYFAISNNFITFYFPFNAINIFIYLFIFLNFTNHYNIKYLLGFNIFITHFYVLFKFIPENTYEYFPRPILR